MASEFRKFSKSGRRQIIDANALVADEGQTVLVCIPKASLAVCRALVKERGYWRTSYSSLYDEGGYFTPDDTDFDKIKGELDLFLEATTDMSCDELNDSLNDIAVAIAASTASGGCGCGSSGAGPDSPPVGETDTGDITQSTGTPPDGYSSWAEYQIAKCDITNWIVENLISDMRWVDTGFIVALGTLGLAAGIASVLSGFTLALAFGAILAIIGFEISAIKTAEEEIAAGKEDLVCAIYTGTNTQESIDNYIAQMESIIGGGSLGTTSATLVIAWLKTFADPIQFNLLYAPADQVAQFQIPPGGDCSACGGGCNQVGASLGVLVGANTWQSVFSSGAWRLSLIFNEELPFCDDPCGPMSQFFIDSLIGWTFIVQGSDLFRVWQDSDCQFTSNNASVYSSDTPIPIGQLLCGRFIAVLSDTEFTMTVEPVGQCL